MKRALLSFLLLIGMVAPSLGAGLIIIHEPDFWIRPPIWPPYPPPRPIPPPRPWPPPQPQWAPMEVSFTQGTIKIKDQVAVTKIEQEFYNPNPRQMEGTFLFPVPKGAQINKFTMDINGKQVEAELMTAEKAKGIYEDIVRKLRDPALLEYSGRDLFKVRIFPIEANAKKRITLSYTQVLKSDAGLISFTFPLNTEKYSAKPLKTISLKVELESKRAIKTIYSPTHKVEIKRDGEKKATIGYEANNVKPDTDFQLYYTQEEGEFGVNLATFKPAGEEGYFMLLASPASENKKEKVIPKDVMFVLDTSGSMAGAKLDQAKKALLFCVENLNDVDRFEIIRFSTEVEPLFDKLADVDKDNRAKAREFITGLKPIGGTAIDEAMKRALARKPDKDDRPYMIIFLTDGRPTIGETDEKLIVKNALAARKGTTRVFCFGIGTDVNTHLLDEVAEETRAFSQYVLPEEDLEVKVSSFYTKIKEPALSNTKLTFTADVKASKMYPTPLPDIFKGEQLIVVGRFASKGDSAAVVEGTINGEARKFSFDVKFTEDAAEHDFIPRLWATRRVGYLLDEIRLRGENKELKDEVTELARKYGIVTPYTAYLIVEDEARRGVAQNVQTFRRLAESEDARREVYYAYESARKDRAGDQAVAGARANMSLKSAAQASEGIAGGATDALRAAPMAAPAMSGRGGGRGGAGGGRVTVLQGVELRDAAKEYTQQAQFVAGRTFYQNGAQWVDSGVQKLADAKRVKVQFGSPEYFDLLKKNPKAAAWFALGTQVQLVLDGTVYEVYE